MEIPLKIKKLVEQKHFTQEEFAKMIGKTKQTINNYFTGRTKIDIDTLQDIADALGVSASYFFNQEEKSITLNGINNMIKSNKNVITNTNTNTDRDLEDCRKELELIKRESALKDKLIEMLERKKD